MRNASEISGCQTTSLSQRSPASLRRIPSHQMMCTLKRRLFQNRRGVAGEIFEASLFPYSNAVSSPPFIIVEFSRIPVHSNFHVRYLSQKLESAKDFIHLPTSSVRSFFARAFWCASSQTFSVMKVWLLQNLASIITRTVLGTCTCTNLIKQVHSKKEDTTKYLTKCSIRLDHTISVMW